MKKLFILFLSIILLLLFSLTGCQSNKNYSDYKPKYGPQFILLESYNDPYLGDVHILVDKESRIMYLFLNYTSDNSNSGITPLYDSEGNVRKYNGAIIE